MARIQKGVTLIELMVVVAVIAVLAAIAYPAYQDQMQRARRSDAKTALLAAAQAMERYYTENNTYIFPEGTTLASVYGSATSPEGYYTLALTTQTATAFTITATRTGVQAGDSGCGNYTYTQTGVRGVSGSLGVEQCWSR